MTQETDTALCADLSATTVASGKVFYMAALNSSQRDGPSQEFYQRKRGEKRSAVHALIALARRLVDVVWALIRDNREWTPESATERHQSAPKAAYYHHR